MSLTVAIGIFGFGSLFGFFVGVMASIILMRNDIGNPFK
jgi:hypothetical protein